MDSCDVMFKPAGRWLDAILLIFPRNKHITTASDLIIASHGFSGEILDFRYQIAYGPGKSNITRDGVLIARTLRWAYRLCRAAINNCPQDGKVEQ